LSDYVQRYLEEITDSSNFPALSTLSTFDHSRSWTAHVPHVYLFLACALAQAALTYHLETTILEFVRFEDATATPKFRRSSAEKVLSLHSTTSEQHLLYYKIADLP